jgi:probable F420-dependent oxidoreductase
MTFQTQEGFTLMDEDLYTREFIEEFGTVAIEAGFNAMHFTEHPAPSRRWLETGGHEALDPLVALGVLAGTNTELRLLTQLTILPYKNPLLFAKSAATLDRLSNGRVILGVGAGYLKSEFRALGVDFDERNDLLDETLRVCRLAWSGEAFDYEGRHFSARDIRTLPTPLQDPLPLWIGGNSALSRRRAVHSAQGWIPQPNPRSIAASRRSAALETLEDLEWMLDELRALAREIGRTSPIDVMFTSYEGGSPLASGWDPQKRVDDIRAQESLGVTWHQTNPVGGSPEAILDWTRCYGEDVIRAYR